MLRVTSFFLILLYATSAYTAGHPVIMVSIKPFYNITAKVMETVGNPQLLVQNNASPHDYTLKPSEAQLISDADLVIWGGGNLEAYLAKPVATLAKTNLDLGEVPGLALLPMRTDAHLHDDHGHDHDHSDYDPHYWLDPENAIIIATAIAEQLASMDADHATTYRNNAKDFAKQIRSNELVWKMNLAPYQESAYIVSHDAFQYFNAYFKLDGVGAVSINPEVPPSAQRVQQIQQMVQSENITCIFSEPQFSGQIIDTVIEGTMVHKGILDPLGQDQDLGPNGYFALIDALVESFISCNTSNRD